MAKLRTLTVTSKGQITLSVHARRTLGLEKGDTLIEVVIGNCLVLLPEAQVLEDTTRRASEALGMAGVSVDEIKAEADRLREERHSERYPDS